MRKKHSHVSFLHVVHHGMMPINTWFASRFLGGGHSAVVPLLNTLVHILMYSYYMVSSMSPSYSKLIAPWKRYLTIIQLVYNVKKPNVLFFINFFVYYHRACFPAFFHQMWLPNCFRLLDWRPCSFLFYSFFQVLLEDLCYDRKKTYKKFPIIVSCYSF